MTDEQKLYDALVKAAATITAIYSWVEKVEKSGGTTCMSGIATCHAMISSLKKNKPRINTLIMDPIIEVQNRRKEQEQNAKVGNQVGNEGLHND